MASVIDFRTRTRPGTTGTPQRRKYGPNAAAAGLASPDAGALALVGYAPDVAMTGDVVVTPGVGVLALVGFVAGVVFSGSVLAQPTTGAVTATGHAPTVTTTGAVVVRPFAGSVLAAGYAPTATGGVSVSVATGVGALTATGYAPSVGNLVYPDLPYALPVGRTFNRVTNKSEGTCLQLVYADDPQTATVNMETTPDSLGRTMGTDPVVNMSILNRHLIDNAALGVRRKYTATGRTFKGTLTNPHNAGGGWNVVCPNGYTYDPTLKVPPAVGAPTLTFIATGVNQPAIRTSTSGAADSHHGRLAIMGATVTHDSTTGNTFGNALAFGLVSIGTNAGQNTLAKIPAGILLHDCVLTGVAGRYIGRALWADGNDIQCRAVRFTEIHRSWTNASDTGQTQDAQCMISMNSQGRHEYEYCIFHGGDECTNLGGGSPAIPNLVMADYYFGHCEFVHNDAYLFNESGTDGPYDKTASDRWHAKNCTEIKSGSRVLYEFCRFSGLTEPNNNQGYLATIKVGAYGQNSPNQTTRDVQFHGCWFDRAPAMIGLSGYESTDTPPALALAAARFCVNDSFAWDLNKVIGGRDHRQNGKRVFLAVNTRNRAYDGIKARHCSVLTDTPEDDGAIFAYYDMAPNIEVTDCLMPNTNGAAVLANDGVTTTVTGENAINEMSGGASNFARITLVPKASMPTGYPSGTGWEAVSSFAALGVVDYDAGDLALDPSSDQYAGGSSGASDGWNRGVSDPAMVYAELAETPSILASHPTIP